MRYTEKNKTVACNVCGLNESVSIHHYPDYPLNSLFVDDPSASGLCADLKLFQCRTCCHIQATSPILPEDLYNENYNFQHNAGGVMARKALFLEHVLENCMEIEFNRVIDVGCNDLSLLSTLKSEGIKANQFIGIDAAPLPPEEESDQDVLFIRGFAEDVEIPFERSDTPDLIISDQVFEHIPNTSKMLEAFVQKISANSVFVIGVPSLELLLKHQNFHMIIHEHVNYFSQASLTKLFNVANQNFVRLTSKLLTLPHGGVLVQSFRLGEQQSPAESQNTFDALPDFDKNFSLYKQQLKIVREYMEGLTNKDSVYGFGASYLTANLAYFMESDFSFLEGIIDETPYKQNKYIPGIKPKIINMTGVSEADKAIFFVTAPQTFRPIMKRLTFLDPQMIVNPGFIC